MHCHFHRMQMGKSTSLCEKELQDYGKHHIRVRAEVWLRTAEVEIDCRGTASCVGLLVSA